MQDLVFSLHYVGSRTELMLGDKQLYLLSHHHLFLREDFSLIQLDQLIRPASPRDPPVSLFPALGYRCVPPHTWLEQVWHPNSSPHAWAASALLLIQQTPQIGTHFYIGNKQWFTLKIVDKSSLMHKKELRAQLFLVFLLGSLASLYLSFPLKREDNTYCSILLGIVW